MEINEKIDMRDSRNMVMASGWNKKSLIGVLVLDGIINCILLSHFVMTTIAIMH
mgnify:CR=1